MENLKKNIFISGSSSGIGFYIAKKLSENKNNEIIINGRKIKNLIKASKKIKGCRYILGDVTKHNDLNKIYKNLKEIDVLICNVGSGKSKKAGAELKKDWIKSFDQNFYSAVHLIKKFEKKLAKSKGIIICISSICGIEYVKGAPITYSVSKSALNTFVKCYSKILGPKGVRLNAIAPGNILFDGSVWQKKKKKNKTKIANFLNSEVSLKKFGSTSDINNMVNFLINNSNFINGGVFVVDGGQTKVF